MAYVAKTGVNRAFSSLSAICGRSAAEQFLAKREIMIRDRVRRRISDIALVRTRLRVRKFPSKT